MRSPIPLTLALLATALCAGCGLKVTSGVAGAAPEASAVRAATRLEASATVARRDGPLAGAALWLGHDAAPAIRAGQLRIGYLWERNAIGPLGAEVVYELGVGEPPGVDMDERGLYNGIGGGLLWPLPVFTSDRNRFYLAKLGLDVVLESSVGVWAGPDDVNTAERLEWSIQLGLRLSLGSDVVLGPEDR